MVNRGIGNNFRKKTKGQQDRQAGLCCTTVGWPSASLGSARLFIIVARARNGAKVEETRFSTRDSGVWIGFAVCGWTSVCVGYKGEWSGFYRKGVRYAVGWNVAIAPSKFGSRDFGGLQSDVGPPLGRIRQSVALRFLLI